MTRPAPPDLGRSWWLREALARPEFAGEPCPPLAGDTDADIVIPALPHRSRSSMAVTEPIPEIIESVGWTGGENVRTLRSSVHYLRTTPDGRIAIGLGGLQPDFAYVDHRCAYHEPFVQRVADDLARIFPKLADYVLPFFGTLAPGNVHHGLGFTGNGPGPSHLGGKICAALASGSDDGFTRLPVVTREPERFPPEPIRSPGMFAMNAAIRRKDDGRPTASGPILSRERLPRFPVDSLQPRTPTLSAS